MVATRCLERRAEMRAGSSPVVRTSEAVDNRAVRLPKSTHPIGAGKIIVPINMRE